MKNENRELTMDELNIVAGGFIAQEHGTSIGHPTLRGTANRGTSDRGNANR